MGDRGGVRLRWLPLGLVFAAPVLAQSVMLVEQIGLLSGVGNPGMGINDPFLSGTPMAVVDMNGDRRDDIVRFHDGKFLNVEYQAAPGGVFGHHYHGAVPGSTVLFWGVCVADVDENGYADIVVGDVGGWKGHHLLKANETGTAFTTVTALTPTVDISQSGIFADLDNDGWLDLFACNDSDDNYKWRNTGGGNFVWQNTLLPTDLGSKAANEGNYGIVGTDYDNDGDVDYYLSKCRQGQPSPTSLSRINRLFRNNGDGTYTDVVGARGLASGDQSWAAEFLDVDNDGDMDCFLLNHESSSDNSGASRLFQNDGNGNFSDITTAAGLAGEVDFHGLQVVGRDFNNDGWVDVLVGGINNGTYGYYQNDGDGTFTADNTILKYANLTTVPRIHSFAVGDLNHDGFQDVYAGRGYGFGHPGISGDLLLFNEGNSNGFLSVLLLGEQSNIHGVGARIEAHGPWGIQSREVRGGESYGIMNSYHTHFGLGTASEVTRLKVRWPSGVVDDILSVPGNRFVSVYEGTGAVAMSYGDWIGDFYPGGGMDAEAGEDPDEDGCPNLVEQVVGTDPMVPNGGPGLVATLEEDGGQDYMRVAVDRVPVLDVALRMEFSGTGTGWATPPEVEVLEDTQTSYVVRLPVDMGSERVMLVRLVVEMIAP